MKKLLERFMTNETLQAVISAIVIGSTCYLYVTGQVVPDALLGMTSIILGFYFHTVAQREALKG